MRYSIKEIGITLYLLLLLSCYALGGYNYLLRAKSHGFTHPVEPNCEEYCTKFEAVCDPDALHAMDPKTLFALYLAGFKTGSKEFSLDSTPRMSPLEPYIYKRVGYGFYRNASSPVPNCTLRKTERSVLPLCFCKSEKLRPCPINFKLLEGACLGVFDIPDPPGNYINFHDGCYDTHDYAPLRFMSFDDLKRMVPKIFPGEAVTYKSADCAVETEDILKYPIEYLNSLTPNGLPPHVLELKKGMILMLLRNMNPRQGLCNGTRLILTCPQRNILICRIASGEHKGKTVLIPRIELWQKDDSFPFEWKRLQFPVRPAFAITINKSQGQTLKVAGIWLEDSVSGVGNLP